MAIDAKVSFMGQLEHELGGIVTVEQMEKIRRATVSLLDRFAMTELREQDLQDDDLLRCYLDAMKVQCRSEKTIQRYEYIIRKLMESVKVPTRRITVYHLRNYLASEKERGVRDSTLEGLRQIFSAYFNWLQREALIEKNPTANLGSVKVAKKEKQIYAETDIEKLIRGAKTVRDQAIIYFLASTGCRISEMTGLDRENVDPDKLECIVHGKGNKERVVFMSQVAGMVLAEYLQTRTDGNPALFVGRRNERLQPGGVREMLKQLAEKTGVDHVHPHKFRRTLATELSRHGMPIQEVANILGHEKIDTTMKYVVKDAEGIRMNYRRYA